MTRQSGGQLVEQGYNWYVGVVGVVAGCWAHHAACRGLELGQCSLDNNVSASGYIYALLSKNRMLLDYGQLGVTNAACGHLRHSP